MQERFVKKEQRDPFWHVKIAHGDLEEISTENEQQMIQGLHVYV